MNFVAFYCGETQHSFARNGEDDVNAYHSDDTLCGSAEFNLSDLLNDELPRVVRCPGCDKNILNEDDHIRACIGYKKPYSEAEIRDSLSDPTEHTKRDALLSERESD
jgi:hypothetical protein